jgi:hypothetical protein
VPLVLAGVVLEHVAERSVTGDLNLLDELAELFPGVETRTGLVVWTAATCGAVIVLAVALGLLVRNARASLDATRAPRPARHAPRSRLPSSAVMAGAFTATGAMTVVAVTRRFVVDGQTVWSLGDQDSMVTLRYAFELAHGGGLAAGPGERVDGIADEGRAFVLSAVHALVPGTAWPSFWVMALTSALLGTTAWAVTLIQEEALQVSRALAGVGGSDQFTTSCAANAVPDMPGVYRCTYS